MTQDSRKQLRDRMNQDRRGEVVAVAARLFAQNGFRGTSMDDIARELGILKGSLYYWIDSKEALLAEVLAGAVEKTIADAEAIEAKDLPAAVRLRELIHSHIQSWIRNPDNFNVFVSEYRWLDGASAARYDEERARLESVYKRLLLEGIERGEFSVSRGDVSVLVKLLFGAMNWFPRWYRPGGWATPDMIADILADMTLHGLANGVTNEG
jgi:AcrR family transcriptional regulator